MVRMNAPCRNVPLESVVFRTDTFFSYEFYYCILSDFIRKVNVYRHICYIISMFTLSPHRRGCR